MGQKQETDQKIPGQSTNRLAPAHDTKVTCSSRLRAHTHRHIHKHMHTCAHACAHTCMHICTHNMHTHACVHTT